MTDSKNDKPEKVPGHVHPDGSGGGELSPVRTSEQGRALAKRRWDAVREAHLAGAMQGFEDVVPEGELPEYDTQAETVAHVLARSQAVPAFVEADTRAARYIATGAGAPGFGTQKREAPNTLNQQNNIIISDALAEEAFEALEMIKAERERRRQVAAEVVTEYDE